ncbi:MAG TPA: terminase, partial [Actinomycetota bacterium]|nr:terminase [Actinomycetota bacterium]
MTKSRTAVLLGEQTPRFHLVPSAPSSAGQEAIDLAASGGLILEPHQQLVLHGGLGERRDGRWAAAQVVVVEPRQNGKDGIAEARE